VPFLISGTDRQTNKPTRFLSNARTEALARKSADALGVEVTSVSFLEERQPRGDVAGGPGTAGDSDQQPAVEFAPPAIRWSGEWQTVEPPDRPAVRWGGLVCALIGFAMLVYFAMDWRYGMQARDEAAADLRALHRGVQSDYEMTFPNNRTRRENDETAYHAATTRYRIDGVLALIGAATLTGGWALFKSHQNKPCDGGHHA
jgi:hypothetical protein